MLAPLGLSPLVEENNLPRLQDILTIKTADYWKPKVAKVVERLHELGIYHGDLHLGNIVIKNDQILLIDFEATYYLEEFTYWLFFKDYITSKKDFLDRFENPIWQDDFERVLIENESK
jgi:RIO-like serine/threonine protein kinase